MNRWRFAIWASNMYYRISQHCIASKPLIFYLIIFLNSSVLSQWRNYLGTALLLTDFSTDYRRLIKPFFNDFWANWPNRLNKLWGIFGLLGTVLKSLLHNFSHSDVFSTKKTLLFIHNPNISQIWYWSKRIWRIAIMRS